MDTTLIGIDTGKDVFEVRGVNRNGSETFRKKLRRNKLIEFMSKHRSCTVALEACGGSHYWAREFRCFGHEPKIIAPQYVKPFVKTHKNNRADAEAICEAAQRPTMRFVGIKTVEQQDLQAMHRVREQFVKMRTAIANEIRGLLMEYGVVMPKGISHIRTGLMTVLENERAKLTASIYQTISELLEEFHRFDAKVDTYEVKFEQIAQKHPLAKRLTTIPGVGPITATAIIASVAEPQGFKNGRQFAAWLGLVPRQHSTGNKDTLLGISKRGDVYLRKLLVHGARSALIRCSKYKDSRSQWALKVCHRRGINRTCVALANKNARVIWVLLTKEDEVFKRNLALKAA